MSFEHLWISVNLRHTDTLLIGCIYLSPSGDRCQSMLELTTELKLACQSIPTHLLVGGDLMFLKLIGTTCILQNQKGTTHTCCSAASKIVFLPSTCATQQGSDPARFLVFLTCYSPIGCVIQDTFSKEPRETLILYDPTASKVKWSRNFR